MGLLNSIGAGLSAAGYAAGDMFARQATQEQASALDLERAKRLAEFRTSSSPPPCAGLAPWSRRKPART
jgi:hypothetical protein